MKDSVFDITIVGAGPTGLCSAVLARHLGLSICVLEKRTGPLDVGRADALNARTQQVLDVIGVLKELRPNGLQCNTSSTFRDGEFQSRNNRWWTTIKNSAYKEFLMIGQAEVERALVKNLDIDVCYGLEVSSVSEIEDLVETTVGNQTITSRYVIAADGGKSPIRKQLGIEFQGDKPNMCWAVLDTFIETNFPVCNEIISFEEKGQSRVTWIPRERGMSRFYILLEGDVNQELSEESVRRHMAPYTVEFINTEWFSTYNVQERVAASFTSPLSKIVLAGDAGHIHAVNGGQGLNTGIADAFALVWRVALAVASPKSSNSPSPKTILASYDTERRTTAQTVVNVAGKLVRSTLRTAQEYVELIEKSAANITGMGIVYAPNSTTVVDGSFEEFVSGARFPDICFLKNEVVKLRLYELVKYGRFLVFKSPSVNFDMSGWLANWIEIWECEEESEGFVVRTTAQAKLRTDFRFPGEGVVIMRPDLYVGYVGKDPESYFMGYLQ